MCKRAKSKFIAFNRYRTDGKKLELAYQKREEEEKQPDQNQGGCDLKGTDLLTTGLTKATRGLRSIALSYLRMNDDGRRYRRRCLQRRII